MSSGRFRLRLLQGDRLCDEQRSRQRCSVSGEWKGFLMGESLWQKSQPNCTAPSEVPDPQQSAMLEPPLKDP